MIDADRTSVLRVAELAWNDVGYEWEAGQPLPSRDVIAQAQRVLSERFGITDTAALALLQRLAEPSFGSVEAVSRGLLRGARSTPGRQRAATAHSAQSAGGDHDGELRRKLVREATRC
jgi:hypothetical protein